MPAGSSPSGPAFQAANPFAEAPAKQPGHRGKTPTAVGGRLAWREPALTIGGLLLGWALVWVSLDEYHKSLAQIEYYAALKQDEQLLKVAGRMKTIRPDAEIRTRLALYHTGRLTQIFLFFQRRQRHIVPRPHLRSWRRPL